MLTVEQNERLTRVGPGTPLGNLMRKYWQPIAPVAVLDENPVKKVTILGEELVLYRDLSGTIGLIQPRCAHRLVHLEFGIPDEHGIRCPYHGWCYDQTGQCTDTPLEPEGSRLKNNVNIGGYPVQELGGLVFAYLGPEPAPLLPRWDFLVLPNAIRQIGITIVPCNWLQCHENSADPYHNTYCHGYFFKYALERRGLMDTRAADSNVHRAFTSIRGTDGHDGIVFERDRYGFKKGLKFSVANGAKSDRVQWFPYNIFPFYSGAIGNGLRSQINMRVPMDDTHTYHISYVVYHAEGVEAPEQNPVPYYVAPIFDEEGEPILDYVLSQDIACWYSQGTITDRSRETLGTTDIAIIQFRNIIEEQITAVEEGRDPINVFRDAAEMGDSIDVGGRLGNSQQGRVSSGGDNIAGYRNAFHLGYFKDDVDRYGPATELASDLMRRAAEASAAK
jgi:5,5'-dehydrodivanillate O-demethylase oxygenase subunit